MAALDFIPNPGGTAVAESTPAKVSCYSWKIDQLLTGREPSLSLGFSLDSQRLA